MTDFLHLLELGQYPVLFVMTLIQPTYRDSMCSGVPDSNLC